ncbi:hypothetical protein P152DRAFT_446645 [Eremomyces bilateralis CBS 781.70]|uniref:Protein kinase domain-containing protein n=1 Tax=Eremomyces bilateralis CBS 781.70 TaxID=1392243 RepID=A0A6G1GBX6_9PEZI|nr:uncharacterized protein P152DRAFT_446645 [Eremomyces bilateralis CBS 781.70]KAF1815598.1 hypothetical protein P152DRAFT_446645 [Eremomyces bilateralis CBS 781.70]
MVLEILEHSEAWEQVDDVLTFSHTKVILRDGSRYFYAITDRRYPPSSKIDPSTLNLHPIPISRIRPVFPASYTRAANRLPPNSYVKRPSLLYYGDTKASTDISTLVLREAQICEILAKSPHPNIARYLGCEVEDGVITGLCFERYGDTLFQRVKDAQPIDTVACLRSIKMGIEHLHGLGIVHGDINPHNILSNGDTFVLTDFDSSAREGEVLGLKGGTKGWTEDFETAVYSNDWHGFSMIKGFLHSYASNASPPNASI